MDDNQLLRYSRQIMLQDIDIAGQERLLAARVLIIGMGGLGCPVAMYLAAAGVGHLVISDFDKVDLTNLQRQIAHSSKDIGRPKVESAKATLKALNHTTKVESIDEKLEGSNLLNAVKAVDIVVDASDNFETRFAVNDCCFNAGTPLVSGAAIQFEGQVSVFDPTDSDSPCYRCLYQDGDDTLLSCSENGVAAPVVGMIGTVQAMETMKLITGLGESLVGSLLVLDAKYMEWRKLKLPRNPHCKLCSNRS
ncbi:MAG: molybdopterin-synthase adenylyltransferase MoeB [Pseudomonadales bacterium]|jgi:adenylyltransferase/sulfurtransferase|nr:molybdopterin-synthase adenylyltransferase MoeB [Pseudomonadales bacterium]MDP7597645.1 molybdopterin-synthase adenylyltransferase MoeB [Pseudomonadales bacterium]HJN53083.1 molybdopterin-synthase adenylyltransferase MoeB [Pseudomonadales bacterium]|tara:strand:+ start:10737 stop:11486 length:750 start_codon:yes stop_codon:yes gene_type:complete